MSATKRIALVKDGVVANLIVAGPDYVPPSDHLAVEVKSGQAVGIGHHHDGKRFSRVINPVPKIELLQHAFMRYSDIAHFKVTVKGVGDVVFQLHDEPLLRRAAARAAKDSSFSMDYAQRLQIKDGGKGSIHLNAKQIVALDDAVTDYLVLNHSVYANLIDGIGSGRVTLWGAVDDEPWPATLGQSHSFVHDYPKTTK